MLTQVLLAALLLVKPSSSTRLNETSRLQTPQFLKIGLVVALVVGLVVGTIWVGGDPLVKSFESVSNELNPETQTAYSGASRNEIWRATLKMFAGHPVLGACGQGLRRLGVPLGDARYGRHSRRAVAARCQGSATVPRLHLSPPQPDRTLLVPPQGAQGRGDPLRQDRHVLCRMHRHCRIPRLDQVPDQ